MGQEQVEREHDSQHHGAGRKPIYDKAMTQYAVSLPDFIASHLERVGDGNLSQGIRRLVEQPKDGHLSRTRITTSHHVAEGLTIQLKV